MRWASALVLIALAPSARASGPRATAVELFEHGRTLAAQGRCAEAVPFFLDTLKIEPSVGALLNLGDCREKLGDAADAYRRFRDAAALAERQNDDRGALARARASALEARLPRIVVVAPPGARVTIDGEDATRATVAEGEHVVRAVAPTKRPWETTVRASGTATTTVVVPSLADAPKPPARRARDGRAQQTLGIVAALAGGAGLATSGVLGAVALAKKGDATSLASGPSESAFDDARASAKLFADASTVAFVVGAALVAAGVTVWLVAPRAEVELGLGAVRVKF